MKIGSKQKALIHVAKTQLGLDDERYRDLLRSTCGVESAKELDYIQYDKLLKRFRELGFKVSHKKGHRQPYLQAPNRDPSGLPSPAHLKKINDLYEQLGWMEPERRIGLNQRIIKRPWPQNRADANKIIEALKSMVARTAKTV